MCARARVCVKDHSPLAPVFPFIISVTNTTQCEKRIYERKKRHALLSIAPNEESILCLEIAKYIIRYLENKTQT